MSLVKHIETSSQTIQQLISGLKSLTSIEGVLNVSIGPTFTLDRNKGYTHALIVDLKDKSILPLYAQSPEHVEVVQRLILPNVEKDGILAMDFEDK